MFSFTEAFLRDSISSVLVVANLESAANFFQSHFRCFTIFCKHDILGSRTRCHGYCVTAHVKIQIRGQFQINLGPNSGINVAFMLLEERRRNVLPSTRYPSFCVPSTFASCVNTLTRGYIKLTEQAFHLRQDKRKKVNKVEVLSQKS